MGAVKLKKLHAELRKLLLSVPALPRPMEGVLPQGTHSHKGWPIGVYGPRMDAHLVATVLKAP